MSLWEELERRNVFKVGAAYLAGLAAEGSQSPQGSARALEHFERAVTSDPEFALAWAQSSYTYSVAPTWFPERTAEYQDAALERALRALAIDPTLPESHDGQLEHGPLRQTRRLTAAGDSIAAPHARG